MNVLSQLRGLTFSQVSEISSTVPVKAFLNPEHNPKDLVGLKWKESHVAKNSASFSAARSMF